MTTSMLADVLEELRRTDCQSVCAWENLIDARRAEPWRAKCPRPQKLDIGPVWDGRRGHGCEVIEVWTDDCGLGDLFMLAPAIRLAQKRARVRLWVPQRMQWLVDAGFFGATVSQPLGEAAAPNQVRRFELAAYRHCSAMDLPGALGINAAAMEEERAAFRMPGFLYRDKCEGEYGRLFLGSLKCNPAYHDQGKRPTDPATTIEALGSGWIEPYAEDRHAFDKELATAAGSFRACITVDTAIAHVAGTLGIPTVIMLHSRPNWRWGSYVGKQAICPVPWYGPNVKAVSWCGTWERTAKLARLVAERMAPLAAELAVANG